MKTDERIIKHLNYLVRSYDGVTKLITQTKQRLAALSPEAEAKHQVEIELMEKGIKDKLGRQIKKELQFWPVYNLWLSKIPGAGPFVSGNLILLYYYRFVPICQKCDGVLEKVDGGMVCKSCGEKNNGDGLIKYRTEEKDFPTISKWWKYMGRHVEDGKMPKRKKGSLAKWSQKGRLVGYQFSEQINRQKEKNPYYKMFIEEKERQLQKGTKKGHAHKMGMNKAVKLFLSHFWQVAREIDGKPVSQPYAMTIMGHTGMLQPFMWEGKLNGRFKTGSLCEPQLKLNTSSLCEPQLKLNTGPAYESPKLGRGRPRKVEVMEVRI